MNLSQNTQQQSPPDDLTVYVDELAEPHDHWLSLTDASRVCRVQDVSIRRAIKRGTLPVRRLRAGQNKRTRFVRASDLAAAGFPIIDESAVISKETGTVDVLSIPKQQMQIMQEQQEIQQHLISTRQSLADFQQQVNTHLQNQQEQFHQALLVEQESQARQLALISTRVDHQVQTLEYHFGQRFQQVADEQRSLQEALTGEHTTMLAHTEQLQMALGTLSQALAQEQNNTTERHQHVLNILDTFQVSMAQEHARLLSLSERFQIKMDDIQKTFLQHQRDVQFQLDDLTTLQQKILQEQQQEVATTVQTLEQMVNTRLSQVEQSTTEGLHQIAQLFTDRLTALSNQFTRSFHARLEADIQQVTQQFDARLHAIHSQIEQATVNQQQDVEARIQKLTAKLQAQQEQIQQHDRLLPLLPYAQQHLATTGDIAARSQALADLALQVQTIQREIARYQPVLALFSTEQTQILAQLLAAEKARLNREKRLPE